MKMYRNTNDDSIITEAELDEYYNRKYGHLLDKWKEEGFYNRDEYDAWIRQNDLLSEFEEIEREEKQ